jgi:hypothetical protein
MAWRAEWYLPDRFHINLCPQGAVLQTNIPHEDFSFNYLFQLEAERQFILAGCKNHLASLKYYNIIIMSSIF